MRKKIIGKRVKQKYARMLIFLVIILLAINYPFIDRQLENFFNINQEAHVDRIIDGDTIESNKTSIRLLGINTPERGEFLYGEARDFLENELLDKNVTLEFIGDRYDKYNRLLAYVFENNININVNMVENGFANYYFYSGRDKYSNKLMDAWKMCMEKDINLCEPSKNICGRCVNTGNPDNFIVNNCAFSCNITNWQIKGEGREKFIFLKKTLAPNEKTYFVLDLGNTGGSLFLRDSEGKLVEWKKG